jgi:hypothetical protein
MRTIIVWAVLAFSCIANSEDKKMDEKIVEKISKIVQAERGWKADEIKIVEEESLKRGSCSFYNVFSRARMLSYLPTYAVISADTIVGLSDDQAVSKILNACGSDAPANWWAEIVKRFSRELGSGVVLSDTDQYQNVIARIRDAKKEFALPTFSDEAGGKTVSFIVLEGEAMLVYFVKATRAKDGSVTVTKSAPLEVITVSQPH